MNELSVPKLYLALIHHPVVNKNGATIASAVTNLDLHDIARAAKTYGVRRYFVITPLTDQQRLVAKIVSHWTEGAGAEHNPMRCRALQLIACPDSLAAAVDDIYQTEGQRPIIVATSAKGPTAERAGSAIAYGRLQAQLAQGRPHLLVFGTAWGLADSILETADHVLEPINGMGDYNHLSVRSAAAIILDRLFRNVEATSPGI